MIKPSEITYQGKTSWTASKGGLVEYVVWSFKGYVTSEAIKGEMLLHFKVGLPGSTLSNLTRALLAEGKILSPKKGVFIHAEHAEVFS